MMKLRTPKEKDEQKALFKWATLYKTHWGEPLNDFMFAVPNGGTRHIREAVSLMLQGLKAGIPDIFIAIPCGKYHGMFVELKRIKNFTLSKKQAQWIERLTDMDYKCVVANGWEHAKDRIVEYLEMK